MRAELPQPEPDWDFVRLLATDDEVFPLLMGACFRRRIAALPGPACRWMRAVGEVHVFEHANGERVCVDDWTGRWYRPRTGERDRDIIRLVSRVLGLRYRAAAWRICRLAGIEDIPALAPERRRPAPRRRDAA